MKFAFTSCAQNGLFSLQHLVDQGLRPEYVITIGPELGKKFNVSGYIDFTAFCKRHEIECIQLKDYTLRPQDLPDRSADILLVNGWNRLITKDVISSFSKGGVGIHAGHPPRGLGRAPLPWTLIKGLQELEVYIFALTENADDGDILKYASIEVTPQDDVTSLYEKVMFRGSELFLQMLNDLRSGIWMPIKQNLNFAEHYPKRTKDDGHIKFTDTCEQIYNFIRAQTRPYPGAFFHLGDKTYKVWKSQPFDRHYCALPDRHPGKVITLLPSGPVIQTGTTPIWLREITEVDSTLVGLETFSAGTILK